MTDLEVARQPHDSWVDVVGPVWRLAEAVSGTEFVPTRLRNKREAVAACILTGRELGLGPMTSLRGIDVIEGAPSLSTELMLARMFAAGHRVIWREVTDKSVSVRIERGDGLSEASVTWTLRDAERAGLLSKMNWQKYPRAMLRARALSECAQLACPDVSLGLDSLTEPVAVERRSAAQTVTVTLAPADETHESASVSDDTSEAELVDTLEDEQRESDAESFEQPDPEPPPPDPDPEPEAEPLGGLAAFAHPIDTPTPISAGQVRALNAILRDIEKAGSLRLSRDERRARIMWAADLHEQPKASQTDLTHEEAGRAIQKLSNMLAVMRADARAGHVAQPEDVNQAVLGE